jgi:saposin
MKLLFALLLVSLCSVQVAQSQLCVICEFVVGEVEKYLQNNATDYEIMGELDKACTLLTDPSWVSACKAFIEKEGPVLIAHIVAEEPPATVCSYVDLCNSSSAIQYHKQAASAGFGDDALCGVCTFLVGDVESYLQDNETESDILGFLEKDCDIFGIKSWVATCQGIVATFGPEIIKLVVAKQPADVVCTEIGLCNSSSNAVAAVHAAPPMPMDVNGTLVCELCDLLVNFTEKLVANNKTESEIIDGLKVVCNLIPIKSVSTTCTGMVEEFGSTIVEYLVNEEPPAVVCAQIGLCKSTKVQKECFAPGKC